MVILVTAVVNFFYSDVGSNKKGGRRRRRRRRRRKKEEEHERKKKKKISKSLEGYNDGGSVKLCGAIDVNSQFTKASPPNLPCSTGREVHEV